MTLHPHFAQGLVSQSARKLLHTVLQQIVLASMDLFGPLSEAVDKETSVRFSGVNLGAWNNKARPDAISFKVNHPNVFLSGIGIYQVTERRIVNSVMPLCFHSQLVCHLLHTNIWRTVTT